jgi:hypothetical protein
MPINDIGSLVLNHIVFLTHIVYINMAFTLAVPELVVAILCVTRVLARRADDVDILTDPNAWPPRAPGW